MQEPCFLGIDLGTSMTKLLMMDKAGTILKIHQEGYPLYLEGNHSEQDPSEWWQATKRGLKTLLQGNTRPVAGISFSGQMHGLVLLDKDNKILRRAILWNDQRTQTQCDYLNITVGREKLLKLVGNSALTGFTAPKVLWVRDHERAIFEKIHKILLPKDYLAFCLTGQYVTDYSDASGTLYLDVQRKCWASEMLKILEISEEQLPALQESAQVIGGISPALLDELDLDCLRQTKGGDQAVGAIGTGTVEDQMLSISLGTSGVVFMASDHYLFDESGAGLHAFCHANGRYHLMGVTLAAAASAKWWVEDILQTKDYQNEEKLLDLSKPSSVYFLPYLAGERTPHNNSKARGTFVGLHVSTHREEMIQAVLEGVAFSLCDVLQHLRLLSEAHESQNNTHSNETHVDQSKPNDQSTQNKISRARIIGGGAKSRQWCQIIANILNVTIERISSSEGPALGAAILAAVGTGYYPSISEACRSIIKVSEVILPDPQMVELYKPRHKIFASLYHNLKETFSLMN